MKKSFINCQKTAAVILGIAIVSFTTFSCTPPAQNETEKGDSTMVEETSVVLEEDYFVIDEHQINDVPLTSKASTAKPVAAPENADNGQTEQTAPAAQTMEEETDYEIYTVDMVEEDLLEVEYEPIKTVEIVEAVIPLDETQTVVSYSKKGKAKGDTLQVISSGNGEIEQVIFTHKKHKDVYDVSAGMSGKEVKRLRKEMKHMVKKGQVFLYDDSSNIMYLMDAQDDVGDEITAAEVENMDVQAIVWKDKKHHKK